VQSLSNRLSVVEKQLAQIVEAHSKERMAGADMQKVDNGSAISASAGPVSSFDQLTTASHVSTSIPNDYCYRTTSTILDPPFLYPPSPLTNSMPVPHLFYPARSYTVMPNQSQNRAFTNTPYPPLHPDPSGPYDFTPLHYHDRSHGPRRGGQFTPSIAMNSSTDNNIRPFTYHGV